MNDIEQANQNAVSNPSFAANCFASCRKILAQIENARDAVLSEFRRTIGANEQLLRLALNEAEALAWQSGIPHLVFPTLALEKAQAVVAWSARQQSIQHQRTNARLTRAA
jgi:hypothetical protein